MKLICILDLVDELDTLVCNEDFPGGSDGKASAYNAGDLGSIPGWGRPSGGGNGNPLRYSCLENPMNGGVWGGKESDTTERLHVTSLLCVTCKC